jgi:hypothetical protein
VKFPNWAHRHCVQCNAAIPVDTEPTEVSYAAGDGREQRLFCAPCRDDWKRFGMQLAGAKREEAA